MANIYDLTDTWSDGNTTYTSIKMNVTNTASSAASKLIDLQVGSSSLFSVDKDGKIADATELQVDNVKVDGNTVSSTTGNLVLDPYSGSKISLDGLLWPNADGTANQMLQTDGAGNLSWGTPAAGYSNTDVDTHLNTSGATSGQTLQWDGSDYSWGTPASSYGDSDVNANLNTSGAATNQVLSWNGSDYAWVAQTGGDLVTDTTPQLGGALDVNGNAITSASAGNIAITPDTTGSVVLDGQSWPQADGTANQVLQTNGSGQLSWVTYSGATGYGDNDVDLHLNRSTASSGEVLSWNGSDYDWVAQTGGGSSYGDADVNTHLNQSSATTGQVLQWDGSDYAWVAQTTAAALGYTAAATTGTVTNTAGTDATLPAATTTNAGLLTGADKTKLDGIEASADVTDTANVTAAGAVMDSELTNEAAVKAINQQLTTTSDVAFNKITTTSTGSVVPFYFENQAAFPSATTYHGAIAHSHADGAMYFAHGGAWVKLADTTAATTSAAGLMAAADKTKLDGIEASADVTDATNVTAAGALMDSELASEAAVKAINQQLTTTSDVAFNDLALAGDLTVNGTNNIIDTTNLAVSDSLIELSNGLTTAPVNDAGIVIERGTADNAFIGWDESDDKFVLGTGSFTGSSSGNLTITKGDVALGTLTTTVGGTDVDVRRAKVETPTTSADFAGDARLYNVATTGLTFTMDDTALNEGDMITLYANGYDVTIAQDATNGFDTVKLDGTTTAHSGNITVANGSIATISVISTTGGSSLAVVAGRGLS